MIKDIDFSLLSLPEKKRILELYKAQENIAKFNSIDNYFTETGPNSRDAYAKYLPFFKAGDNHKLRAIFGGNRSGKSLTTCYELALHLSGEYPDWWEGKRFDRAYDWWVCGEETNLLRQSIIKTLVGPVGEYGTGLIRHRHLDFETMTDTTKVATTLTALRVKHKSGKYCQVDFKTYNMPRTSFQAAAVNLIFDEEPPMEIFAEANLRTMTLGDDAMVIMNFTPKKGMGTLITEFLEGHPVDTGEISKDKYLLRITMDDAPHLTQSDIATQLSMTPPYLRDAVRLGLPSVGEGNVYPIEPERIVIEPLGFPIPTSWKRFAAMDFGFKDPTVVLWFALDPDTGIIYQYAEHYLTDALVSTHADIIRAQNRLAGYQIPLVCDPSGGGTNSSNGEQVRQMYFKDYSIPMISADNSIHAGIAKTFQTMVDGKLKIYKTCPNTIKELREYKKHKNGFVGADHAMDALRYGIMSGQQLAKSKYDVDTALAQEAKDEIFDINSWTSPDAWMSR